MKPNRFFELMSNYNSLQETDLVELQELLVTYPYFQTARVLWNYNLAKLQNVHTAEQLKTTAAYAGDRRRLFSLFHQNLAISTAAKSTSEQVSQKATDPNKKSFRSAVAKSEEAKRTKKEQTTEKKVADKKDNKSTIIKSSQVSRQDEDKLIKKSVEQAQAKAAAAPKVKMSVEEILAKHSDVKRKKKANFMKVYYAVEQKNVLAYMSRGEHEQSTLLITSIDTPDSTQPLSEEDVENFIQHEVRKMKSDKPRQKKIEEEEQDLEEERESNASSQDHEKIIDKLITNLHKAKDQAKALSDDSLSDLIATNLGSGEIRSAYSDILNEIPSATKDTTEEKEVVETEVEPTDTDELETKKLEHETAMKLDSGSLIELAIKGKELGRTYIPLEGENADEEAFDPENYVDKREDIENAVQRKKTSEEVKEEIKEQQIPQPEGAIEAPEEAANTTEETPITEETTVAETKFNIEQETKAPKTETVAERVLREVSEKRDKLRKEKENATTSNKATETEKKNHDPAQNQRKSALIDRFIEEQPSIERNVVPKEGGDIEEVKKSEEEDENLATEALAKLYITQKYYAKAIATYQKLSLKYPEKNAYFADQIDNVKKLMNQE